MNFLIHPLLAPAVRVQQGFPQELPQVGIGLEKKERVLAKFSGFTDERVTVFPCGPFGRFGLITSRHAIILAVGGRLCKMLPLQYLLSSTFGLVEAFFFPAWTNYHPFSG